MNVSTIGRLIADPEGKRTDSGTEYVKFTIAVDAFRKGEKETRFIDCLQFGKRAGTILQYFSKGSEIVVHGSHDCAPTIANNGKVYSNESIMVNDFNFTGGTRRDSQPSAQAAAAPAASPNLDQDSDDDIPF